jgi:NAD(P)-dependent dehydrogenase (short-subunit alcohol dehydrogenase family)
MRNFAGKVALVTGAAHGIGLGIARALARQGVHVAIADIAADPLEQARAGLAASGATVLALPLDVSDSNAVERAAAAIEARFGKLNILVNNAGVAPPPKPVSSISLEEWAWLIGVNLYGVIHGVRAFLPLIRRHGEGGHIVNTASIAGYKVRPGRGTGGYAATKFAVVAFSESLAQELDGSGIGVSVLCPAAVNTTIYQSARRRPQRFGGPFEPPALHPNQISLEDGLPPDTVGERVVQAIRDEELFIFTHEEPRGWLEERHRRVLAAFDSALRYNRAHGIDA